MGMGQLWHLARVLGLGYFENSKLLTSAPYPSSGSGQNLYCPHQALPPAPHTPTREPVRGSRGLNCLNRTQLDLNKPSWVTVLPSALFAKGSRMKILLGREAPT